MTTPPRAAGALKKRWSGTPGLRPESGGFSCKIHAAVDALGTPIRLTLTSGATHDVTQGEALTQDVKPGAVIADKGYDSDPLVVTLTSQGAEVVIPPRSNRKTPREYDHHLYKERHLVECFFNKIKQFRRIFSRFDKLAKRYLAFLILCWGKIRKVAQSVLPASVGHTRQVNSKMHLEEVARR